MTKPVLLDEDWLARITEAVTGLKYGTVQIVVHDGRIVQIERTERFRYENSADGKTNS
ncbi:MAG: hypothetical protein JWR03_2075 [Cohnella sp.]|jgi:hypothetical protein|nr:hypothetical protein [Cohnella sp.]